jgi:hypothetical protein
MDAPLNPQDDFAAITQLIAAAKQRSVQAVNTTLDVLRHGYVSDLRYESPHAFRCSD